MVQVASKVLGAPQGPAPMPTVTISIGGSKTTVREIIRLAVEGQLARLKADHAQASAEARRALNRQYLSEDEVRRLEARGSVKMPSERSLARASPEGLDEAEESQRACAAFERGVFLVLVNGRRFDRLDEAVALSFDAKVVFVRLTPLVGG
jgi:hypothetical protein